MAMLAVMVAAALPGCRGCGPKRLRRFGATCGRNSECVGGVCYQGRCTRSCKDNAECGAGVCIESICHEPENDLDGDGLSNTYEVTWKLDPANTDTDDDGKSDGEEIGPNPDAPNDSNGDGVIDAIQSNTVDSDGDCVVDAIDIAPGDSKKHNLPTTKQLCNLGVCADDLSAVKVVCRPDTPVQKGVAFGCLGCGCEADKSKVPDWQASETVCDHLDNDCDGVTDEAQLWLGLPVGATCQVFEGICGQVGDGGVVPSGVVECLPDSKPGCSVTSGGSQSIAKPESCNLVDDDCDGQTDEGFSFNDTPAGGSCNGCGEAEDLCEDGSSANPPVVSCNLSGDKALCSALPFANGFSLVGHGAPPPRLHWTAAWNPDWQQLLLYGGEVPTAFITVPRADLWSLELATGLWKRLAAQPPGHRKRAALVWDKAANRMLMLGGSKDGEPALAVWSLGQDLKWQAASSGDINKAQQVPALPFALAGKVTKATIINNGKERRLFVFAQGLLSFWSVGLGGGGQWKATSTSAPTGGVQQLTGAVRCVVPEPVTGGHALALVAGSEGGKKAGVYRLTVDPSGAAAYALVPDKGAPPPDRRDDQCVLNAKGQLHLFGGKTLNGLTDGQWQIGTFPDGTSSSGSPTWKKMSPASKLAQTLTRNRAVTAWDAKAGVAMVAGGLVHVGTKTGVHRLGRNDVLRWQPETDKVEDVVKPTPRGRIGQASGRGTTQGNCIGGGLFFDLPDLDGGKCRVRPATDAWCSDDAGNWTLVTDNMPPYAFGIAGVDSPQDRMVLAGGYVLNAGGEVTDVRHLWRGGLTFDESKPLASQPKVSNVVRTLDLKSGVGATESLTGPQLAAATVVHDPVRRRLISFGGFDNKSATRSFWQLDLQKLIWKDLNGGVGPMMAQYGSVLVYDPVNDQVSITGGIQHFVSPTGKDPIGMQVVDSKVASTKKISACHGNAEVPMLVATPTAPAEFHLVKLSAWGDPDAADPSEKLFRIHFSQPAFVPTLFDPIGRRGLIAVPDVMPAKKLNCEDDPNNKDKNGKQVPCVGPPCAGNSSPAWTDATSQIRVALGRCAGKPRIFLAQGSFANLPTSMFMASTTYDDATRRSWVWGGLEPDGSPSTSQWRLEQACVSGKP